VEELVDEISKNWPGASWRVEELENNKSYEANLLQLNCEKALRELTWNSNLDFKQTSKWTAEWYHAYYKESPSNAFEVTLTQIYKYMELSEGNS
jgi:CDP-glucose 4,6-dehydratase